MNRMKNGLLVLLISAGALADGEVESLSACEPAASGTFEMMCICAKGEGERVDHKDLSSELPKGPAMINDKDCEEAAAKLCEVACKQAKW